MPHLATYRKGWESEGLARFILSKFSFVAHPATVADDVGSDFYCTLFQTQKMGRKWYLVPRNAFAIQVKSSGQMERDKNRIPFTKHWPYLWDLEIPFFVGVADREELKLTIYSGEYIPMFFSYKGRPKELELEVCAHVERDGFFSEVGDGRYVLRFPKVAEIRADMGGKPGDEQLEAEVQELQTVCSMTQDNIASRRNRQYLFKVRGHEYPVWGFAGVGSVASFRESLLRRLVEVFLNLRWLRQKMPSSPTEEEFEAFKQHHGLDRAPFEVYREQYEFSPDEFELYCQFYHQLRLHHQPYLRWLDYADAFIVPAISECRA